MKTPLAALLVLSLAGNAVLAFFVLNAPAPTTKAPTTVVIATDTAKPTSLTVAAPAAATTAAPVNWQTLKPGANLRSLIDNLRAAGFPPAVIRAVANQLVSERLNTGVMDHLPFWKQNLNNPEYLAAQQQLSTERRAMLDDLLGADNKPSVTMDPAVRERRYGQLSDEKVDQLEALSRDMNDLRSQLYANRKTGDMQGTMTAQQAAEKEQHAELAAILSPAELEQYEMRSSPTATRLMANVKDVEINEDEYAALFRAQKNFDAADPYRSGVTTPDAAVKRYAAQAELNDQARAVLTDDRFYEYLKGADNNYARAAQFTASYPQITPAMTYDLTKLEQSYQAEMLASARTVGGVSGTPNMEQAAVFLAKRQEYQNKVNALLGPEAGEAYTKRNRPGTTTTRTVVRPGGG